MRFPIHSTTLAFCLLALFVLPGRRAAAQAPAERHALGRLRDSIGPVVDETGLRALRDRTRAAGPNLRHAIAVHRLGELTGNRGFLDESMAELGEILRAHQDWPEAWYELALLKLTLYDAGFPPKEGPYQRIGMDYLQGAAGAFIRALQLDPGLVAAADRLAPTVLRQVIQPMHAEALPVLRAVARGPAADTASVHLDRGLIERETHNGDSALVAFTTYLRLGGDSGVGYLEQARTLFDLGQPRAAQAAYFEGARLAATRAAVAQYRADLAWIAQKDELAAFDSLANGAPRQTWLQEFWDRRDVGGARRPGERLAEHYRRWFYVMRNFRLVAGHRPGVPSGAGTPVQLDRPVSVDEVLASRLRAVIGAGVDAGKAKNDAAETNPRDAVGLIDGPSQNVLAHTGAVVSLSLDAVYAQLNDQSLLRAYRSDQRLVDDRGVVYMRHGEPAARATYNRQDAHPNESWKYVTAEGPLLFHFVGSAAPTTLVDQLALNPDLLATRGTLDVRYYQMSAAAQNRQIRAQDIEADRQLNRKAIAVGTTTDGYALTFEKTFAPVVQSYGVRHGLRVAGGDGAGVLVVFAVPAEGLTPEKFGPDSVIAYPIRVRIAAEARGGRMMELDTLRLFATRRVLGKGESLSGQIHFGLPAGTYVMSVVLADRAGRAGAAMRYDSVRVAPSGGRAFGMSDVVIGELGSPQRWIVGRDTVALNPNNAYRAGGAVEVYYQLGGLVPGASYRTHIEVRRRGSDSPKDRVALDFSDEYRDAEATVSRSLGLASLRPGDYELEVVVQDQSGTKLTRRTFLNVVPR